MLEHKIRIISESLARGMDRRAFLRRAGGAIVSGAAALVLGPALTGRMPGAAADPIIPTVANCSPPGPYCNLDGQNEPNACRGGACFQHVSSGQLLQCQIYGYSGTGCWTTVSGNGYWTCCDCTCSNGIINNVTCGCAQYSRVGAPYPNGPEG